MPLDALPDDILYHIFHYLRIPDLVRLHRVSDPASVSSIAHADPASQVSKRLNEASHARAVWKAAYHRSPLPLPPAPSADEPVSKLEAILAQAERSDRTWASPRPRPSAVRVLSLGVRHAVRDMSLIWGRWLIVHSCVDTHCEIACFDINRGPDDPERDAPVASYSTGPNTFVNTLECTALPPGRNILVVAFSLFPSATLAMYAPRRASVPARLG